MRFMRPGLLPPQQPHAALPLPPARHTVLTVQESQCIDMCLFGACTTATTWRAGIQARVYELRSCL